MRKFLCKSSALVLSIVMLFTLGGCGESRPELFSKTYYQYFDTVSTVSGFAATQEEFDSACKIVENTLWDYHRLCDIYNSYDGIFNLRSLNAMAGQGPQTADDRLLDVLAFGKEAAENTDGMCNVAMGSVFSLWHDFREAEIPCLPAEDALQAAAIHANAGDLILDFEAGTAELRDPQMRIDLGGIAKGYATEMAARALKEAGYTGYALSIGGNIRVIGTKAGGSPWVTGIQDPTQSGTSAYVLKIGLENESLVTSGSYQRFVDLDGVRYHHIISPRTLRPENDFLSVSIKTPDSGMADALSTAVFNMTAEEGLAFINGLPNTEACWILADGSLQFSSGFEEFIIP